MDLYAASRSETKWQSREIASLALAMTVAERFGYLQTCPKSIRVRSQGEGVFPVAAYFGPDAGEQKGQNPAVSKAMEGEANVAEGIVTT